MDQVWEIIGIVIAVLMVMIGLRLLLKKPQPEQPIEQSELLVEAQSQQPIVPRHLRQLPQSQPTEPATIEAAQEHTAKSEEDLTQQQATAQTSVQTVTPSSSTSNSSTDSSSEDAMEELLAQLKQQEQRTQDTPTVSANANLDSDQDSQSHQQQDAASQQTASNPAASEQAEHTQDSVSTKAEDSAKIQQMSKQDHLDADDEQDGTAQQNTNQKNTVLLDEIEAVDIDDWQGESDVLDAHLSAQDRDDEESALATAEQLVALYMYPHPVRALSGERTIKMMLKYGLRFGEMSCFHRYEHPEHPSPLMFSVLRINDDGAPTGFDLETLPNEEVKGLAFFLALPNPNSVQGFDMMASIAGLIARDTEGLVFDEQSLELTPQLRDHWRHFVIEYRSGQSID